MANEMSNDISTIVWLSTKEHHQEYSKLGASHYAITLKSIIST